MDKLLVNSLFFLIGFLPIALITGSFLADFFISISSIVFLYLSVKNELWRYYNNTFFKMFIIFYTIINICSFFSEDLLFSLATTVPYIRFIIFAIAVSYILDVKKNFQLFFFKILFFSILTLLIDGLIQYFSGRNSLAWILYSFQIYESQYNFDGLKLKSFFGKGIYGSYLLRFSPIFFALFLTLKYFKYNNFLIFIFFLFIPIAITYSGERSSLILFFLFTIYNFCFLKINKSIKFYYILSITFIITYLILIDSQLTRRYIVTSKYLFYTVDYKKNLNQINNLDKNYPDFKFYNQSSNYTGLFKTATNMFNDKIFFGQGPRTFKLLSANEKFGVFDYTGIRKVYFNSHPHNYYFQLLAETGLLGFTYLCMLFFTIIYFSFKISFINRGAKFLKNYQILMLSSLFIFLWPITTTSNFFNNWTSIFHYLSIGFLLNIVRKKNIV